MHEAAMLDERGILFAGVAVVVYFLPWTVAIIKSSKHRSAVAILNVFLGWTVVGWFAALALAEKTD